MPGLLWNFRLEIDDQSGLPLTIDSPNRGFTLTLREKNEHALQFNVRDLSMDSRIVRLNRCRIFGDYNNPTPTTKQFEGIMTDKDEKGEYNKVFEVLARDFFKDRLLTKSVNKKYTQQLAGVIFRDIVQTFMGSEFTVGGVQDTVVKVDKDYPHILAQIAADTLTEDSVTEYFCKPSLDVTFRPVRTEDSGITITEAMVRSMAQVKRSYAESVSDVIVVGGLDAGSNRVVARATDPTLPTALQGRKYPHQDQKYTTWQAAKLKALGILTEMGRDFMNIPPIEIQDMPSLPRPGQFVTLNMPSHGINNVKVLVRQIEIPVEEGESGVQWIKFWLGETEKTIEDRILMQQYAFEKERARGISNTDIATATC